MKTLLIPEPGDRVTLPGICNVEVVEVLDADRFLFDGPGSHRTVGYVRDIMCYVGKSAQGGEK